MKNLTREQRHRKKARDATLGAIAFILFLLMLGILIGSGVTAAVFRSGEPDAPDKPEDLVNVHAASIPDVEAPEEPEVSAVPTRTSLGEFTITHYCACERCCGKSEDNPWYGITATGTEATEGRTVAVDPSVIPYGSEVVVCFDDGSMGYYIAEDTGGSIRGNRLDVYMESHTDALEAGVKSGTVYVE